MIFSFLQYFCFDKKAIHMSLKNMSPDFSITRKWRKHNKSKTHLFLKSYLKKKKSLHVNFKGHNFQASVSIYYLF